MANVNFYELEANAELFEGFVTGCQEAVAENAGELVSAEDVKVFLSAGSVLVTAEVSPPNNDALASVQSSMNLESISESVGTKVRQLPNINDVSTGVILVEDIKKQVATDSTQGVISSTTTTFPGDSVEVHIRVLNLAGSKVFDSRNYRIYNEIRDIMKFVLLYMSHGLVTERDIRLTMRGYNLYVYAKATIWPRQTYLLAEVLAALSSNTTAVEEMMTNMVQGIEQVNVVQVRNATLAKVEIPTIVAGSSESLAAPGVRGSSVSGAARLSGCAPWLLLTLLWPLLSRVSGQ